ncbi:MAG: gliding motility-associated C-terminal domain-containing protein [Crocinitomicaceae bacterium]|nr:gliding motility-associated C-terminal domain-containing protein [Crocinitomicaceae bacterium]
MKLEFKTLSPRKELVHLFLLSILFFAYSTEIFAQCPNDFDCDGINDLNDFDDDNDGISDVQELSNCIDFANISNSGQLIFDEDFGSGPNWGPPLAPGTISYCYEDGAGSCPTPAWGSPGQIYDGSYSIMNNPNVGFPDAFRIQEDHTPNDVDGYQVVINADFTPGEIYRKNNIAIPSSNFQVQTVVFSAWISNIGSEMNQSYCSNNETLISPNVDFLLEDNLGNQIGTPISTGNLPFANNGSNAWIQYTAAFQVTGVSTVNIVIRNNAPGGCGNDLAIDDITLYYADVDCDFDEDGISDYLDLDSDNDGIFDVVEGGDGSSDTNGDGMIDSNDTGFSDLDGNGFDDSSELTSPINSDNDGIPDYLDLDSDDDGCFDSVEAGHLDSDNDGILGVSPVQVDWAGTVLNQGGYTGTTFEVINAGSLSNTTINYSNSTYTLNSSNDTPTITGGSNGSFSSSNGLSIDAQSGEISPANSEPGEYLITYSSSVPCSNSATFLIIIEALEPEPQIDQPFTIEIPNVISLSSTVGNDIWFISYEGIETYNCIILNRWGNVLFESDDPNEAWEGTSKSGKPVTDGVYFYLIKGTTVNGGEIDKHGPITVLE